MRKSYLKVIKYIAIALPWVTFLGIGLIVGGIANYFIMIDSSAEIWRGWEWYVVFGSVGVSHILGVIYTNAKEKIKTVRH